MSKPVRIGIVGAGGNTRRKHIPGFQEIEGVSIEVVCNRSESSSRRVADEFGIPRIAADWRDVAADPEIDAVMIGTWPYLHAPVTLAALDAGKHVLCEARMAMNLAEAEAMLAASQAKPDLVTQVVPSPFTLKWDRFLARSLREGLIGDLLAVDALGGGFLEPDRPVTWREQKQFSGLNIMGLGIVYEAMARWVGHAATVDARGRIFVTERDNGEGQPVAVDIPDHLDVFGDLENGAAYHIRCSRVAGGGPDGIYLYGSTGTIHLDLGEQTCTLSRPDGSVTALEPEPEEAEQWRVEAEYIGAIRGEESIRLTSFDEGVRYMRFTQQVADAVAEHTAS